VPTLPTAVYLCTCRGVRTANLHAVRSAITATAELLVNFSFKVLKYCLSHFSFLNYLFEFSCSYL